MLGTFFRRVGAYFVDTFIVSTIVLFISMIPFLYPNRNAYVEKYEELATVSEKMLNQEMSEEEYREASIPIEYDLYRLNTNYVVIDLICVLLYFGVFQAFYHGQTLGKKLLRIRVVGKDGEPVSVWNFLLRTVILNNVLITIVLQIVIYVMSRDNFYDVYNNINLVGSIILYITLFMVLVRQDGRGLHDMVAGTKVEMVNTPVKDEVIEVEAIEEKEKTPKKEVKRKSKAKTAKNTKTKN